MRSAVPTERERCVLATAPQDFRANVVRWCGAIGQRRFTLAPTEGGTVRFTMNEKIGGPLFPLFARSIPSFDESFDRFAADLERAAESQP